MLLLVVAKSQAKDSLIQRIPAEHTILSYLTRERGRFSFSDKISVDLEEFIRKRSQIRTEGLTKNGWLGTVREKVSVLVSHGLIQHDGTDVTYTAKGEQWTRVIRYSEYGALVIGNRHLTMAEEREVVAGLLGLRSSVQDVSNKIDTILGNGTTEPPRLVRLKHSLDTLAGEKLPVKQSARDIKEALFLMCRKSVSDTRARRESLRGKIKDPALFEGLDAKIQLFDEIRRDEAFFDVRGVIHPQITDFINVGSYYEYLDKHSMHRTPVSRIADEKFGILNAPALFSPDFIQRKTLAFERRRSFAVAFVDIDLFKHVNSRYTEVVVDRDLLPYFMRGIEAFCFGRASAYRQGGDEYLVILNNSTREEACDFFDRLVRHVRGIDYPDNITDAPTVSVGFHVVTPENDVSLWEAVQLSNIAKNHAKDGGRNRACESTRDDFLKVTGLYPVDFVEPVRLRPPMARQPPRRQWGQPRAFRTRIPRKW